MVRFPGFADGYIMVEFNSVDAMIPFCEWFILPYVLWYPFILFTNVLLAKNGTKKEYMYLAIMTIAGMLVCLITNTICPTEIARDPNLLENLGRSNILTKLTAFIYACDDPPRVVFPSMHVYGSVVLAAALVRSRNVKGYIKTSCTVLAVLICLSTVFVKQHSIIDLVAAVILFAILHTVYIIVEKIKGAR